MIREKPSIPRIILLVVLLAVFLGLVLFFVTLKPQSGKTVVSITDHWEIKTPAETLRDISLAEAGFGSVNRGDLFVLRNSLPKNEVDGAGLQMQTVHATLKVSVDGKQIYADGEQYTAAGKMTPTLFHFVPLPEGYGGRELMIELTANETGAFSAVTPIMVGDISELYLYYITSYRFTLFISLFLMMTGILMLFVFFFLWNYYKLELRILFSSLLALDLGLYILCFHELTDFLNARVVLNDFLEYIFLYTIPFLSIGFLACTQTGRQKRFYIGLAIADFVALLLAFLLHALDIVHVDRMVLVCHIIILVEGTLLIVLAVRNAIRARANREEQHSWQISDRVLLLSFFLMLAFAMIDIVRYLIRRFFSASGSAYADLTFMLIGAAFFVTGLFINFFYYHIERIGAEKTTEHLAGLAYTDPLTGMANRSRCEKLLEELNEEGGEYTVVSMDVDYLKRINDTFGHSTGDKYLVDMAAFIRKAFPDAALHGRMGGDEFIVVMRGNSHDLYKECTARLRQQLKEKNESGSEIRYGISYGCAYTHETKGHTLQAAFEIADVRMYEMKKIRHAQEDAHAK